MPDDERLNTIAKICKVHCVDQEVVLAWMSRTNYVFRDELVAGACAPQSGIQGLHAW